MAKFAVYLFLMSFSLQSPAIQHVNPDQHRQFFNAIHSVKRYFDEWRANVAVAKTEGVQDAEPRELINSLIAILQADGDSLNNKVIAEDFNRTINIFMQRALTSTLSEMQKQMSSGPNDDSAYIYQDLYFMVAQVQTIQLQNHLPPAISLPRPILRAGFLTAQSSRARASILANSQGDLSVVDLIHWFKPLKWSQRHEILQHIVLLKANPWGPEHFNTEIYEYAEKATSSVTGVAKSALVHCLQILRPQKISAISNDGLISPESKP